MEQTIEGNKTIAEFMGGKKDVFNITHKEYYKGLPFGRTILITELKYHSSWDWLMPVISKTNLIFESGIQQERGRILWEEIYCMLDKINIERTWLAVVYFIQWYNNSQSKTIRP